MPGADPQRYCGSGEPCGRMLTSNSRDAEQAFLAAEALRNGEIFVLQTRDTDYGTAGTNGLYDVTAVRHCPWTEG